MESVFRVEFELPQEMCSNCKKSSSEYYELLTQIRFIYFEDINIIKEAVIKKLEQFHSYVNRFEEVENGFDVYVRNHSLMSKFSSLFQREYIFVEKRSKKLIGRDNL